VPTNDFDERIARSYEARWPELFEPAAIDPVVLRGRGDRPGAAAAPAGRDRASVWEKPVGG
jgi:hypothetical protein